MMTGGTPISGNLHIVTSYFMFRSYEETYRINQHPTFPKKYGNTTLGWSLPVVQHGWSPRSNTLLENPFVLVVRKHGFGSGGSDLICLWFWLMQAAAHHAVHGAASSFSLPNVQLIAAFLSSTQLLFSF